MRSLKFQFDAVLDLPWIRDVARSAKSKHWIGRQTKVSSSVQRVEVRDIDEVGKVEEIESEFGANAYGQADFARDTQVEAGKSGPFQRVAAERAGAVAGRVAIQIGVRAVKDGEEPAALGGKDRAEPEIAQHGDATRNLTDEGQGVAVAGVLA